MDFDLLKTAYRENAATRAICDHMSSRDRNQSETKTARIIMHLEAEGFEFKRAEVIAGFRHLEAAGAGTYVEGRRGWQSRFVWSIKSLTIGDLATGSTLVDFEPEFAEYELDDDGEADFITHTFVLRANVELMFRLPQDLTPREASRLARFFESLPFGEDFADPGKGR